MKRWVCYLYSCIACLLALCACTNSLDVTQTSNTSAAERTLSILRAQYRDALYIVQGICSGIHTDENDRQCCDLTVTEAWAGDMASGSVVHCTTGTMQEGQPYLLYLKPGDELDTDESVIGCKLMFDEPLRILDSQLIYDGKRIDLAVLRGEIEACKSVIAAPAQLYDHGSLQALSAFADEIFIGRVSELPELTQYTIAANEGGVSQKGNYNASIVTIEAFGSMKGTTRFGQQLQLVYCPTRTDDVVDAETLFSVAYSSEQLLPLEQSGIYLFFLKKGPDPKQNYYFPVNPAQGFTRVHGDQLCVSEANRPLADYQTLQQLVPDIQATLYEQVYTDQPEQTAPGLVVIE